MQVEEEVGDGGARGMVEVGQLERVGMEVGEQEEGEVMEQGVEGGMGEVGEVEQEEEEDTVVEVVEDMEEVEGILQVRVLEVGVLHMCAQ